MKRSLQSLGSKAILEQFLSEQFICVALYYIYKLKTHLYK